MSARVMSIGFLVLLLTSVVLAGDAKTPGPDLVKDSKTLHGKIESKVEEMLSHDGPWLLFGVIMLAGVGIPISEEILIVPAGFLIERGVLPFWSTVAAAWTGVVLADLIWMLLVRRFAHKLLSIRLFRRMFHPRRILEIKYMLDKWGAWVVVMGRILPAARTPVITAAGLAHMPIGMPIPLASSNTSTIHGRYSAFWVMNSVMGGLVFAPRAACMPTATNASEPSVDDAGTGAAFSTTTLPR